MVFCFRYGVLHLSADIVTLMDVFPWVLYGAVFAISDMVRDTRVLTASPITVWVFPRVFVVWGCLCCFRLGA